jgi:DNA-binding IclR family transcriptional regulator
MSDSPRSSTARAEPNQSVEHAFAVLKLFAHTAEPMGIVDISRRLGLSLGTCHRVLTTMCAAGFASQGHDGGKYEPGLRVRELLLALYGRFPIRAASMSTLKELTARSGLASSLSVPLGDVALRVGGVPDRLILHRPLQLGMVSELHIGAAPRAILASLPEARRLAYVRRQLPRSQPAREALLGELDEIRARGHVITESPGLRSVAFPIRNGDGHAIAAVALEGASAHFTEPPARKLAQWRSLVAKLELLCQADPSLARGPFDHLPLGDIDLEVGPTASRAPAVQSLPVFPTRRNDGL